MSSALLNGDPLEREYADFIASRLPGYLEIWSAYVGNDGRARPVPIDLSDRDSERRSVFLQYHYSCLESALCMCRCVAEVKDLRVGELGSKSEIHTYLRALNLVNAFYSHLGRVRDLAQKMSEQWRAADPSEKLDELYKRRSNVLHEPKSPAAIVDGALAVLPPEGAEPDPSLWGRGRLWANADPSKFELVEVQLSETFDELIGCVNDFLRALYSKHILPHVRQVAAPEAGAVSRPSITVSGTRSV